MLSDITHLAATLSWLEWSRSKYFSDEKKDFICNFVFLCDSKKVIKIGNRTFDALWCEHECLAWMHKVNKARQRMIRKRSMKEDRKKEWTDKKSLSNN